MQDKTIQIALAGLLHDIGKLEQRARVDPWNPPEGISEIKSPIHAAWSMYFIEHYVPEKYRQAAYQGAFHHHPEEAVSEDKFISELVSLADKLSAGERADMPENYPKRNPPQQMVSIFDQVTLNGSGKSDVYHYLPLAELKLEKSAIFPKDAEPKEQQGDAYEELRKELEVEAGRDCEDGETYLENLLGAMQRYTWCVPSAYYHSMPDVSLYDHSRMTAALAVCLAEKSAEAIKSLNEAVIRRFQNKAIPKDESLLKEDVALLIGGDISGVQNFIYTISSKRASKTLRGRSFYLQLLTEAVLRYVLRELELPYTNVIYAGGGHFFLLAPLSAESKLPEIQKFISRTLIQYHGTSLYLALGHATVPAIGFQLGNFPKYWNKMHESLANAKQHRYAELGEEMYEQVFKPKPHGGNRDKTCEVCGEEHENVRPIDFGKNDKINICSMCLSFSEQIGSKLPDAEFVAMGFGEPKSETDESASGVLKAFGMEIQWHKSHKASIRFDMDVERSVIWAFDNIEKFPAVENTAAAHLLRYTVKQVPRKEDPNAQQSVRQLIPKSFDELQKEATGIKRLGVLRLDVDNLGEIFKRGLRTGGETSLARGSLDEFAVPKPSNKEQTAINNKASLARLSTLSFQISLFFEGWVKKICQDYRNQVYAVYAGGDDVFLIGPWNTMLNVAREIVDDLKEYTGGNPDIHVSGGMAFIGGKYPVYQAAADAAEAEEIAKKLTGKNAFTFLDEPWKWEEFADIKDKKDKIVKITQESGGPSRIIQTLRNLASEEAKAREEAGLSKYDSKTIYGPWMWQGIYSLTRMIEREGKNKPALAEELKAIRESLGSVDKKYGLTMAQWGTAARWAQLETRQVNENK